VDVIIGWIFLPTWILVLLMAATATVVETVTNKLDDNLLIPLFSGFIGQLAFLIMTHLKYLN